MAQPLELVRFLSTGFYIALPYGFRRVRHNLLRSYNRYAYVANDSPRNIVIIGGSFAGVALAKELCATIPSEYRVVLIERNSHFNYTFVFQRYSVVSGHEEHAFMPLDTVSGQKTAPQGSLELVQDTVVDVTTQSVVLASGRAIEYTYLAVATGATQPVPARLESREKEDACEELRSFQGNIKRANRIALVGGGAVGVQMASDIKSFMPDKEVTLVQSRGHLLPSFGTKLHEHVLKTLKDLGVRVLLNERPDMIQGREGDFSSLSFKDGRSEDFDLVIPCTGQRPNSNILGRVAPNAISPATGGILVKPTLQIDSNEHAHVFALGDVAETGGPKMARAGERQAQVVANNIMSLIQERQPNDVYKPLVTLEGATHITLGKAGELLYTMYEDGNDILIPFKAGPEDLNVAKAWRMMGASFEDALAE